MPVTAKFVSDFSDFQIGVAEAEKNLAKLGVSADRTGASLTKMTGTTTTLGQSMRQFDGALSSVGVNLSPQIRALDDFGAVAGKTAAQVGKFGVAGLVLAAGMEGWKFGRNISELLDLDKAIGDATAALLGWGDVSGQTSAAVKETIDKANAAGAAVTSYAEAIKFNQKAHEDWKGPANDAIAKLAAFEASIKQTAFEAEHLTMAQVDLVASALAVGKSHAEIAAAIGLSTDAIDLYIKGLDATEKAEKIAAADAAKLAAAIPPVAEAMIEAEAAGKIWDTGMVITTGVIEDMVEALTAADAWTQKLIDSQSAWDATKAGLSQGGSFALTAETARDVAVYQGLDEYQLGKLLQEGYKPGDALDILRGQSKDQFTPKAGAAMAGGLGGGLGMPSLAGLSLGGGPSVVINQVNHIVDTEANIVRRVSEGITRSILQGTKLGFR